MVSGRKDDCQLRRQTARTEHPRRARQRRKRRRTATRRGPLLFGGGPLLGGGRQRGRLRRRRDPGRALELEQPALVDRVSRWRTAPDHAQRRELSDRCRNEGWTNPGDHPGRAARLACGWRPTATARARVPLPGAARAAKAPSASSGPSTAASSTPPPLTTTGDLWIAKSDGSEPRQLTNDGGAQPQLRPDGTGLFFLAGAIDGAEIRSVDLDGSNAQSIETGGRIFRGSLEVSETHLYLNTQASGMFETFRVPIAGGARERLFTDRASVPPGFTFRSLSPDGRRAAGTYNGPDGAGLAVVSIDGSARPVKIPYVYTPGLVPRIAGRRVRRRSKPSCSRTGRPTSGASRSTARRRGP